MKKIYLSKVLLLFIFSIFIVIPLYGCNSKQDKEIVVAKNVKEDLNSAKSELLQLIEEGNAFLQSGKYPEARSSYEKAISKDKTNESTYLQIKDNYMKAKRFDDAYYIIKLAIDNNVSKDAMSKVLEEIKSNFSPILIENTISEGADYSLPTQTNIPEATITNPVNIRWPQKNIDTSSPGTFTYDGYIDEYGRTVHLTLTIKKVVKQANSPLPQQELSAKQKISTTQKKEVVKSSKIGFIDSIYEENGDTFIKFNETEFYRNGDAQKEYAKDGFSPSSDAWGHDYYIRDNNKEQKTYKLSKDCKINVCIYLVDSKVEYKTADELRTMSKDDFKIYVSDSINKYNNQLTEHPEMPKYDRALLFWINSEDDIVTSMNMQYTP
ncbi:Ig-like domain-containing protein [Clostridium sp. SHJSY1]|uniref:Ig-like domain-containing protein n=1 Tax=Clostridium sp. SHJSY1 TaxID=2942483 RepID=UPI002874526D|nr:Ig-like domain-containing protein [Clostridium sp. SHJSY1]MDS0527198.1 Ig-like domain-containing protein [Clostridium sp. SHJSY1]